VKEEKSAGTYVYNNDHAKAYREVGAQAVSYTTGVPAVVGALMVLMECGKPGVFNVEQCDPDPFMKLLGTLGLAWHEVIDQASPFEEK